MNLAVFVQKSAADLIIPAALATLAFLVLFLLYRTKDRKAPAAPKRNRSTQLNIAQYAYENGRGATGSRAPTDLAPRFLLLGTTDSGKSSLLSGLHHALAGEDRTWMADLASGLARWHFAGAEVFEVAGGLFEPDFNGHNRDKEWKAFLARLQKQRPQRPADGIILAVPSTQLAGDQALSAVELQRQAVQASKKLKLLREQLGFSFPIYVVITKCDVIPGYGTFIARQFSPQVNKIFGWSNPYNLDAPFDPNWTVEAFGEIQRVLTVERMAFFLRREGTVSQARDEIFLFPVHLQELQLPLATYLGRLFQDSGHREGLQFRGLYFSGRAQRPTEAFEAIRPEANWRGADFTRDLFTQKVFLESGLARPLESSFAPRNSKADAMRGLCAAATLVLFTGAALSWYTLSKISQRTLPHLQRIAYGLKQRQDASAPAYAAIFSAQAITGSNFRSAFLPASMFDSLDEQVEEVMPPVFNRVVYPGLRTDLEHRTAALVQAREDNPANIQEQTKPTQDTTISASQQLADFTDALLNLENNILVFNKLAPAGRGAGQDMLSVGEFLAPEIFKNAPSRSTAAFDAVVRTSSGTPFDGKLWTKATAERLQALATDVLRGSMKEEQLLASLRGLLGQINLLEKQELDTYGELDSLRQSLARVQTQLAAVDLQWIASGESQLQLPDELNRSLTRILSRPAGDNILLCDVGYERSSCANLEQLKASIEQATIEHMVALRELVLKAATKTTGPLIVTTNAKLQLSSNAARLQSVLDNFLTLPFVAHEGAAQLQDVKAGQQLFWDNDRVQAALQDKQAYDKFFSSQLANTPLELQDTFEEVALSRLEANMVDAVASAEQFQPLPSEQAEQANGNEIRVFAATSQSLTQVLDQFAELNFDDAYQDLLRVSTSHALMLLTRIDSEFAARHFYWPAAGNFDQWTGDSPPSFADYGAQTANDMPGYLAAQRQYVQQYAAAAQPLIAFLQQRIAGNKKQGTLVAKWQSIVSDMQKYDSAPAASGLGSVEDFLSNSMDKVLSPECQVAASPVSSSVIYFVQVRRSLERALVARCRLLSNQSALRLYSQFADFFNQRLAGKFPFSAPPADNSAREADPADVTELFRRLDADGTAMRQGLQVASNVNPASVARFSAFLNQVEALRPLFSFLTGPPGSVPAFDIVPAFRVNRSHEINGNQIIDWRLQVGESVVRNSDPPANIRWTFGQPVKLILRWAKDSPQQPVAVAPATVSAGTRTVIFDYQDPWSLLRMLALNAPAPGEIDPASAADPQVLTFIAGQEAAPASEATRANPAQDKSTAANQIAKVFIRIKVAAPEKTDALRIPKFPAQAPVQ